MNEVYYQFIYERMNYGQVEVVCGVRLYKSVEDFYKDHARSIKILKMIPHKID